MYKNKEVKTGQKAFLMRLPRDLWLFLKTTSAEQERSMQDILITCLEKYKKRLQNRLTDDNTMIS